MAAAPRALLARSPSADARTPSPVRFFVLLPHFFGSVATQLVLALCLASATEFAPPKAPTAATASTSSLEATVVDIGNENEFAEFGGQMWDPIGLR